MTQPADFPIIFDRPESGLAVVTLNRPHRRNGIVPSMMTALYAALREAAEDRGIRVLVITGAGQDFCPGADIGHYADGETRPAEGFRDTREFDVATLLHEAPAVTIAAIRGACAGAGFGWACACDFRIADDTAKFNTAFLGVGVAGDMGVPWTLPRLVGAAKARELSFLPHKFDAAEAERIGLVNRMVPAAEFEKTVEGVTAALLASAPLALTTLKANYLAAERMGFPDFVQAEAERHTRLFQSRDTKEAFSAFAQKRKPVFEGR